MNTVGTNSLGFSCSLFEYFQLLLTFRLLCCSKILKIEVEALSSHFFNSVTWYAWKYADRFHEKICHLAGLNANSIGVRSNIFRGALQYDMSCYSGKQQCVHCTTPSRWNYYTLLVLICKVFVVFDDDIPKIIKHDETYLFNWWIDERSKLPSIENAKRLHEWLNWRWLQHGWPSSLASCDPSDTNDIFDLRLSRMFCWFSSR